MAYGSLVYFVALNFLLIASSFAGGSAESAVIATYCGEISSSVNSTSNKLYIRFRTDGSVGQRGFHLEYSVLYDYCKLEQTTVLPDSYVVNELS